MSKIKTLSSYIKNKVLIRFICLIISAIIGIYLSKYCHSFLYEIITNYQFDSKKFTPLIILLLVLPTTTLLWYFRTHDTRENIHQNDFFDALKMLTDDKVVRREIATQRLINLTKKVPEYKEEIKLAFIKVLKSFPRKELGNNNWESEKRTYAQHILKWFNNNNYTAKELDLNDCIFDLQEFTIEKRKSDLFKLFTDTEKQFKNISFKSADLSDANLQSADLSDADLSDADLSDADLSDANLIGAKYSQATKFPLSFQLENKGMKNIHITQ